MAQNIATGLFPTCPVAYLWKVAMNTRSTPYYSRLYRDFQEIEGNAYRRVVRFYEACEDQVVALEFEECFDLQVAYCKALFEIGAYQKHLAFADGVIEAAIINGIRRWNGADVYFNTLFDKAASHHNRLEFERAEHILRELLKMQPDNEAVQVFLRKNARRKRSVLLQRSRAASIAFFLAAAVVICVEMLFVRTLYPVYEPLVQAVRTSLFAGGLLAMVGGDLLHRLRIHRRVAAWTETARVQRRRRKARTREKELV